MSVLGPGAYGDPDQPWLTREQFDAEHEEVDADESADTTSIAPADEPVADETPSPTQDES